MTKRLNSRYKYIYNYRSDVWGHLVLLGLERLKKIKKFNALPVSMKSKFQKPNFIMLKGHRRMLMELIFRRRKKAMRGGSPILLDPAYGLVPRRVKRKSLFGKAFLDIQRLKKFYLNLKWFQFKKSCLKGLKEKWSKRYNWSLPDKLVVNLEMRLDILLYRSYFMKTMFNCRQFINHKNVLVNGILVDKVNYILKPGDVIEILKTNMRYTLQNDLITRIRKQQIWPTLPPEHLEVDYKSMRILITDYPKFKNLFYPFKWNVNSVSNFILNKQK